MKIRLGRANKTIASVVVSALTWSDFVIHSKAAAITAAEWQLGAGLLAAALGVYAIANELPPPDPKINTT